MAEKVPKGQRVHEEAALDDHEPALQVRQDVTADPADAAKVPALQPVHEELPIADQ